MSTTPPSSALHGLKHLAVPVLHRGSPLSQKLSLREVREGAHNSLAQCLVSQFRLVTHVLRRDSDFKRGVKALLIDKSGPAQWQPPTLEGVGVSERCLMGSSALCQLQNLAFNAL